ncbi:MAG: PAS domain S-box protein [Bacteroidales bacterium]|nr:PAS domain S-box protein [Bacteroidales bacterium]
MNLFQNFTIRSRFNFINVSVFALILIVVFFFYLTFNRILDYNKYNDNIDKLKIQYLNLRRYEQHFLLRYSEDSKFFISGENKYIDKLKNASKEITRLTNSILENSITEKLNLTETVYEIITVHSEYMQIFIDLSKKIYIRGSLNSGLIGELKSSAIQTLESSDYYTKKTINEMIRATDDYLYTNNEEYYFVFLKKYEQLLSSGYQEQSLYNIEDTIENAEDQVINYSSDKFLQSLNKFKNSFSSLVKTDKILGRTYEEGLEGDLRRKSQEFNNPVENIYNTIDNNKEIIKDRAIRNIFIFFILIAISFFVLFWRFSKSIVNPLNKLKKFIEPLSFGILPEKEPDIFGKNEITNITKSINNLIEGLKKTTSFAGAIGVGEYSTEYKPLSNNDSLGNALIEMRENLISTGIDEEKRKDEDKIRTWTNIGLTKFNDILIQNQGNIKEMSTAVISDLVKFINANQGGMFVFSDDEDEKYLELTATYAYGKEKKKNRKIFPGEGIIGMVALEKETVYMTEIPETYITITSGLGGAVPRSLLIVPMIVEEDIIGVIELASFNELEKHEIEFVKTLSENIASSLSITKINQRTAVLLEQSQRQAELMKVQEEEMRQNFEELQQIQEDSSRRSAEMAGILAAIDTSSLVIEINISGKIISVNRGLLDMLGVPETALTGTDFKDFIQSVDDDAYNIFWQQLMNGANIQRNEHIKIEDKELWFSVVYAPIIDDGGKILYILSIATDLSESKKLEFELKEQEKILRQNLEEINKARGEAERKQHILENTNEMLKANEKTLHSAVENAMKQRKEIAKKIEEIAEEEALSSSRLEGINLTNVTAQFDLNGKILSVNKIFEDIFGYTKKEIISKNQTFLLKEQYISSDNYKQLWENLKIGKHISGNFTFQGKNNKKVFLQGTYTAIRDASGKTISIILMGFDTTDLVMRTEELKACETELELKIQDLQMLREKLKN